MQSKPPALIDVVEQTDAVEFMRSLPDDSVDLVFTSPPYALKEHRYGGCNPGKLSKWISWIAAASEEIARVSRGYGFLVVNNCIRNHQLVPAYEGLVWELYLRGVVLDRSIIWTANKPPSRNRKYFKNGHEFIIAVKELSTPYFDWESVAHPQKFKSGGHFRQRRADGKRVKGSEYPQGELAVPYDHLKIKVGGGFMGLDREDEPFASEGEAPFPVALAQWFIKAFCPVGGLVLDPFMGSGTTAVAAKSLGRHFLGCDIGEAQVHLSRRRIEAYDERQRKAAG